MKADEGTEPSSAEGQDVPDASSVEGQDSDDTPDGERGADVATVAAADDDDTAEDEDTGDDLAAEMVAVFDPESDDSDAVRGRRYRALLPAYRRMGWTAPELLPAGELSALDGDVWRGMFVSGELERTWTRRAERCSVIAAAIWERPALWTHTKTISGTVLAM